MTSYGEGNIKLKVVVLGDAAVGKTSIAVRFTKNSFADNYTLTIAGSFCTRSLFIANKKITYQIWDTAGTERFRSVVPFYLRDADVAIVTYDISDKKSFENIHQWLRLLQESAPQKIKCALVGNKSDKDQCRQVTKEMAETFADKQGLYFLETSAKTGQNVQQLFVDIGSIYVNLLKSRRSSELTSSIRVTATKEQENPNQCCG